QMVVNAFGETLVFVHSAAKKLVVLRSMMKTRRMNDPQAAEEGYPDLLGTLNRKPYPSIDGLRNAQRLMVVQNPKVANVKVEDLVDSRFIRKLDESGFIDK